MKRIAGSFVLLAGLSGCVTFTSPGGQGDRRNTDTRVAAAAPSPPMYPTWAPTDAGHPARPGGGVVPPPVGMPPTPAVYTGQPTPLPALPADLGPAPGSVAAKAGMPDLPGLPPGMPMAATPPKPDAIGNPATDPRMPEIVSGPPAKGVPMPAAPEAPKGGTVAKAGNGPLFRLVNTKRITLNFEVKDVGSSGLAAVDLWYTQDGKDWRKHEAPANAQAYGVEVDEEGMYGFTLVARSGIGLGLQPPAPGDQPQVWVIVDLTAPDVQLPEVTPTMAGKSQHVTINWQASDKNLGRQPVTLSYSEKPDGPWQVIASNLDAMGSFKWNVKDGMPAKVYLKAEAFDMAGNVGQARSAKPIMLDNSLPNVRIVNVEASGGR